MDNDLWDAGCGIRDAGVWVGRLGFWGSGFLTTDPVERDGWTLICGIRDAGFGIRVAGWGMRGLIGIKMRVIEESAKICLYP